MGEAVAIGVAPVADKFVGGSMKSIGHFIPEEHPKSSPTC